MPGVTTSQETTLMIVQEGFMESDMKKFDFRRIL